MLHEMRKALTPAESMLAEITQAEFQQGAEALEQQKNARVASIAASYGLDPTKVAVQISKEDGRWFIIFDVEDEAPVAVPPQD